MPFFPNFLCSVVLVTFLVVNTGVAHSPELWKRVHTGEDSVIDLNTSRIEFDVGYILRIEIRTILNTSEELRDKSRTKYLTRLETVEYNLRQPKYRIIHVVLLDSSGRTVQTFDMKSAEWRPLKPGGMMERLIYGVQPSLPFGRWNIVSSRLVEGTSTRDQTPPELERLIGGSIWLEADRAIVNESSCGSPAYKSERVSLSELSRRLGVDVKLSQQSDIEMIIVNCESDGWAPPRSLLIKLPEGEMLMLWNGVFLTIKRS